jgi:energy-coupling factor transporter transmembrane protein EcfT
MELFKGLFIGEIVLLFLGIIFFLVLLILLVYLITKKRAFKPLIPLFIFPILMIGFPSVKKIKYDNGVFEIEKEARFVKAHPDDKKAELALTEKMGRIELRANSDPSAQIKLANANLIIGDTVSAKRAVDKALRINPDLVSAHRFNEKFKIKK